MRYHTQLLRAACACACLLGWSLAAHAQTHAHPHGDALVDPVAARQQAREIAQGDPQRWYREDATREARLRTIHKEMGAALREASNACKRGPAAERSACMKRARTIYQNDLAQAKQRLDEQHPTP
ncbi:hypothetical protein [Massilia sp. H6]|uniref:hypothetical protein n=1 Tax=Massilia sp. H6 TaxID=2970464 RepID=UPI002168EC66|nr:hypothetical protein [Massilia sp. H6]UVW30144.1 hypothetical protein NRS07_08495 [Massilia sp. H6]